MTSDSYSPWAVAGVASATAIAVLAVWQLYSKKKPKWFSRVPDEGRAAVFDIEWVMRKEQVREDPLSYFGCKDRGATISVEELFAKKGVVLFNYISSLEIFVFLEVSSLDELYKHPFLDRAIPMFASNHAYTATFSTVASYLETASSDMKKEYTKEPIVFVWNTGRCGSTLMHRILTKAKFCSLSEPYWFDQLSRDFVDLDEDKLRFLVKTCHNAHFHLAHRHYFTDASHFAINPKLLGSRMMSYVMEAFPNAKHMFMYRDGIKVVGSFYAKVVSGLPSLLRLGLKMNLVKRKYNSKWNVSKVLKQMEADGKLVEFSSIVITSFMTMWVDAMLTWMEVLEEAHDSKRFITLRMNEFVHKDKREAIVKHILDWAMDGKVKQWNIQDLMRVYETDSQEGSKMGSNATMANGSRLGDTDKEQMASWIETVPKLNGSGHIFPGSLFIED